MEIIRKIKKWLLDYYDYDRKAERLIYKSITIFRKGGTFNHWRAIRLYNIIRKRYCCDIWPGIKFGKNTYIAHAQNISIGPTAEIGDNCRIYPSCSIAAAVMGDEDKVSKGERRHAKIGDNCIIGEHSMIVGAIEIGHNVVIGAGAVVRKDVPSYAIVAGNPAKIVGFTMRPIEAYENECANYPEESRIMLEQLEATYNKHFRSRMRELMNFSSL